MQIETLEGLLREQTRNLYSGERQIIEALPAVIERADDPELLRALERYLEESRTQKRRIQTVAELLHMDPGDHLCVGMEGILRECDELLADRAGDSEARDAAIVLTWQRVGHYVTAGFGSALTYASEVDEREAASLLREGLAREKAVGRALTDLARPRIDPETTAAH